MAIAYARVGNHADLGKTITDVTLDGSYPAGGYPLSNSGLGLAATPESVLCNTKTVQGVIGMWDKTNNKLKMMKGAAGLLAECASGDISTANVITLESFGIPLL